MVAHNTLTGAELHESKGADTAAVNTVQVSNGAGAAAFQALTYAQMPSGSQIGYAETSSSTATSTTVVIPFDDTIPQNTEGTQLFSLAYTPKSATSTLVIEALVTVDNGSYADIKITLFKDSETSARATAMTFVASNQFRLPLRYSMVAGSTSSTTFSLRYGSSGGTAYVNSVDGVRKYGGSVISYLTITEIKA